ncbi:Ribosome-binding ATPase YchF [Rickettsiales endosymbiont of Paramecium tredecaurelia]|uniref:redox-regulated ATPase YchF n=1 Tax=Candidatus Sarmatiella mevalonica TaxID=2770581 RepID=UPI0019247846|nr:redox-regulated ATPase YchF [Candidatus Sarmatiella mevalonica]MBL3284660.1 Ribosome-binding ATPase YchF [Candidatus Sarmatiella mevalonica]
MSLKCGIVGLPNVGKSTLFNALTSTFSAQAANYPFCTIEPNSGIATVEDQRLDSLSKIANSEKIIRATVEFVDIAGLVKGASKGEGLGNKFLAHIREVDAVLHVLRCFENKDIIHVYNKVDPLTDMQLTETELIIADLESVDKRIAAIEKKSKQDPLLAQQIEILRETKLLLASGKPAIHVLDLGYTKHQLNQLQLLTGKKMLYALNVGEDELLSGNEHTQTVIEHLSSIKAKYCIISSQIESEIAALTNPEEKAEFLDTLGIQESGLTRITKEVYSLLDLKSFFTIGPKEARAWTAPSSALAPETAGIIHSDFERGFIKAEVISYNHYIEYDGENGAKNAGKMRIEGRDYLVQDGDVILFRFNV